MKTKETKNTYDIIRYIGNAIFQYLIFSKLKDEKKMSEAQKEVTKFLKELGVKCCNDYEGSEDSIECGSLDFSKKGEDNIGDKGFDKYVVLVDFLKDGTATLDHGKKILKQKEIKGGFAEVLMELYSLLENNKLYKEKEDKDTRRRNYPVRPNLSDIIDHNLYR